MKVALLAHDNHLLLTYLTLIHVFLQEKKNLFQGNVFARATNTSLSSQMDCFSPIFFFLISDCLSPPKWENQSQEFTIGSAAKGLY